MAQKANNGSKLSLLTMEKTLVSFTSERRRKEMKNRRQISEITGIVKLIGILEKKFNSSAKKSRSLLSEIIELKYDLKDIAEYVYNSQNTPEEKAKVIESANQKLVEAGESKNKFRIFDENTVFFDMGAFNT
jgi:septal ring factor EnvC (AmiA/AmiB activator)